MWRHSTCRHYVALYVKVKVLTTINAINLISSALIPIAQTNSIITTPQQIDVWFGADAAVKSFIIL